MVRKLHLNESNNLAASALASAQDRVKDEGHIRSVYNLDKKAFELYKQAELNTDIIHANNPRKAEIGYKAYWDLEQYLRKNNMDDDVLYDLAADFAWNGGLSNACKRFDKQIRESYDYSGREYAESGDWYATNGLFDNCKQKILNLLTNGTAKSVKIISRTKDISWEDINNVVEQLKTDNDILNAIVAAGVTAKLQFASNRYAQYLPDVTFKITNSNPRHPGWSKWA